MMKVAIISHMYPSVSRPTYGRFIHEHVKALQELGVQTRVIAPVPWTPPGMNLLKKKWRNYSRSVAEDTIYEGIEVRRPAYFTPPQPLHFTGGWGMATSLGWSWKNLMSGFDCDLIHAHAITPDGLAACRLGQKLGLPVVCSARGSEVHLIPKESSVFLKLTRWTLQHCDEMVAVSGALAREAVHIAGEQLRPNIIYNGVAGSFRPASDRKRVRQELNLSEPAKIILFVGRCEWDKGVNELFRAFEIIHGLHPLTELVLLGSGGAQRDLQLKAQSESWGEQVHFIGTVGRDQIARYLQAADIFVLPSHGEGMPNALLEAMSVGLPCVATTVGGIPEAIQDGENGLLVPPQCPTAIAMAFQRILESADLGLKLGAAAEHTIKRQFTWHANAEQHLALYQRVMAAYS
jgi:glycosyltransferase involved in cell wall biosynthesis